MNDSQKKTFDHWPLIFDLVSHPLTDSLGRAIGAYPGELDTRQFPDGESYLRILSDLEGRPCIVVADLSNPDPKFLPLLFLLETLRELGASQVGLIVPYLSYMRQDRRFVEGEALTSRIFAQALSKHIDWLVTVDPHLHRYHSLDEIYSVPNRVVQGAPALAQWLKTQNNLLLVGPDSESEQWVSNIAAFSQHPYVIGEKQRYGDRHVEVTLPDIEKYQERAAVIIDDVISSGQTILECIKTLRSKGIGNIQCVAIHGIFAGDSDQALYEAGLNQLVTTNTVRHSSNAIDITPQLIPPVISLLKSSGLRS
ncbi:ribose-phosphate diphosphokinase [Ketobacter alkanivorans]|jgi:ribose-phosphate pyrophosphokinase|uniref:ribose-phosphate diphosphokinase n=1 Tax=Ketobacter alkanivorans TaxID=1917421 RepID=A0A2K9LHU3_9GAMM|nr:ribose-phosphate diphosphokinase [Ketobacter alkanivorans]MAR91866.1 ribose-phosphate pyrophosphokinase [Pseudomonadales bacterium]HAG95971.1 ribose-phosphate pyrophosphokinase [Gammaproteobacteria bacterium]AUM11075.1 ribose-phosphate pyrophosphokinase [Ketobacter alkanivorans]MAR93392.1 ribose-phosphate pyrophosphokinase [Pseudomonadales bacterium]HBO92467.1 ribose-phosphate pyrophosphokinase [Gammaproteobacteria bacterium]|tara:strand:+ start:115 stop:1044 length:930 start_codon:yes stop_codon:yes gene_type:complete